MYKCECGKEFNKPNSFNAHKSRCKIHYEKLGKLKEYKEFSQKRINSLKALNLDKRIHQQENELIEIRICEKCGIEYCMKDSNIKSKRFCSNKCAYSRILTIETKNKISNKLKKYYQNHDCWMKGKHPTFDKNDSAYKKYNLNPKKCIVCNEIIPFELRNRKTCSKKCYSINNSKNGGYKENSSRGKKGYYKGIKCDSQWELAYLIYCLDHGMSIQRNTKTYKYKYNNKIFNYLPDFIVDNQLVEIKNYHSDKTDSKIQAIIDLGLNIKCLYTEDLQNVFEYVIDKYKIKNKNYIYTLYDYTF